MAYKPDSQTRFYRNKRDAKVSGICAGIADYTGLDVSIVRLMMLFALFMSGGSIIPFYFIAGWITPDRPAELQYNNSDERQFWQGVRASPARTARELHSRLRDINRRLADVETYVTSDNRVLADEIERLR